MSFKFEFSEKWIIVKVDGHMRRYINKCGKTAFSNEDPKIFFSKKDAEKWIEKHSYQGMSFRYEVKQI